MGWAGRSGLIPEFSDTVRGEVSVEGSPPNPEVIDDIPDKRVVHRVLEHCLGDAGFLLVQYRGRPPLRPRFRAAARPALVFSTINSR